MTQQCSQRWGEVEARALALPVLPDIADKQVILFAPRSIYGNVYLRTFLERINAIACVDDLNPNRVAEHVPTWSTYKTTSTTLDPSRTFLLDFSNSLYTTRLARRIAEATGIPYVDFTQACAALDIPIIYEKALLYRAPNLTNVYVHRAYGMYNYATIGLTQP